MTTTGIDFIALPCRDLGRTPAPSPFRLTFTFADPEGYLVTVHDDG